MRAEKVVATLLRDNTAVSSIVGSRVYGGVARENVAAPYVVYAKVNAERVEQFNPDQYGVVNARIEVLCVASSYEVLKNLGEAVRLALSFNQNIIVAGVKLIESRIESEGADEYAADLKLFGQTWTFIVTHAE